MPSKTPLLVSPIPRSGIPGLQGKLIFLILAITAVVPPLALATLTGTSPLPLAAIEAITIGALVLTIFYVVRRGKPSGGVLPLMIFTGILLTVYTGSLLPAAVFISLLFTTGEAAVLIAVADKKQATLIPLIPMASFILATLVCGSWEGGLISLFPFLPASALALGTRNGAAKKDGLTRVGIICLTSLFTGLSAVAIGAILLYKHQGGLDFGFILEQIEAVRAQVIATLNTLATEAGGTVAETFTPEAITDMVNSLFNLLPAYAVLSCNFFATFAQMFFLSGLRPYCHPISDRLRVFRISAVSCAVFILAYIVMLVASGNDTVNMTSAVAENLVVILTPALAWAGLLHFSYNMARRGHRGGCMPLLLFIAPVLLFIAPAIPAFYEAIYGIAEPFIRKKNPPPSDKSDGDIGNNDHNDHNDASSPD